MSPFIFRETFFGVNDSDLICGVNICDLDRSRASPKGFERGLNQTVFGLNPADLVWFDPLGLNLFFFCSSPRPPSPRPPFASGPRSPDPPPGPPSQKPPLPFRARALQTPPTFHEKTPKSWKRERKLCRSGKKRAKFWALHPSGPTGQKKQHQVQNQKHFFVCSEICPFYFSFDFLCCSLFVFVSLFFLVCVCFSLFVFVFPCFCSSCFLSFSLLERSKSDFGVQFHYDFAQHFA